MGWWRGWGCLVWSLLLYGPITGEEAREERRGGERKREWGWNGWK